MVALNKTPEFYELDFYAWTQEQANLLQGIAYQLSIPDRYSDGFIALMPVTPLKTMPLCFF